MAVRLVGNAGDHPVRRGAHGRAVCRFEIDAVVMAEPMQDRMVAIPEPARDAAELQRRAQERALERAPLIVVEPGVRRVEREPEREIGGPPRVYPRPPPTPPPSVPLRPPHPPGAPLQSVHALDPPADAR